jgi:hypothetical protein
VVALLLSALVLGFAWLGMHLQSMHHGERAQIGADAAARAVALGFPAVDAVAQRNGVVLEWVERRGEVWVVQVRVAGEVRRSAATAQPRGAEVLSAGLVAALVASADRVGEIIVTGAVNATIEVPAWSGRALRDDGWRCSVSSSGSWWCAP